MLYSNTSVTLLSKINITDTAGDTFNISVESENGLVLDTGGSKVSFVLVNKKQRERFEITISSGVCTIVSRGITQQNGTNSVGLQKQWIEGTVGYITALDFDIFEKDGDTTQVVSTDTQFDGNLQANTISTIGSNYRIRKDGNDMKFRDDNQSEISLSSLAAASGSDEKTKVSNNDTTAGYLNGKLIAGDGINFTENNDGGNESLDIDIDITDSNVFSVNGTANTVVVTDGSGNIFPGTTTKVGGVKVSSDTDVSTGTDLSKYASVGQIKTYYGEIRPGTDVTYISATTERYSNSPSDFLLKELGVEKTGMYQINFDLRCTGGGTSYLTLYIDGKDTGLVYNTTSSTYLSSNFKYLIGAGSNIQLYVRQTGGTVTYLRNVTVTYNLSNGVPSGTVITD